MKLHLKYILLVLLCAFSFDLIAQTDSTKTEAKKIESEINAVRSTNQLKAKLPSLKTQPNNLNFTIENKVNKAAINKNLNNNKSNSNTKNFLMETLPEDKDIMGKKYWKGKDVTHQRLASNFSLGTVKSTTKVVRLETRDHSYIDGDRIKVFLNEQVVSTNIGLKGNYFVIYLTLEPGYNRIDFMALNQGLSGPNTAEFKVYDQNGTLISDKEWNLATGQTATLGIIKY